MNASKQSRERKRKKGLNKQPQSKNEKGGGYTSRSFSLTYSRNKEIGQFRTFVLVNNKLISITDSDKIKSIDVREDGVYMTYIPADGADPVSKKLGKEPLEFMLNVGPGASGTMITRLYIDLTDYELLTYYANTPLSMSLSTDPLIQQFTYSVSTNKQTLDISNLQGKYYIANWPGSLPSNLYITLS